MADPVVLNFSRTRADTEPVLITVTDENDTPRDVTGASYLLTIDTLEDPPETTDPSATEVFAVVGVLSAPLVGEVDFPISPADADQTPLEYFYDIQQIDAGSIVKTIAKGTWTVNQDITKVVA